MAYRKDLSEAGGMNPRMLAGWPVRGLCLTTIPAHADWAYTHWGMTPEQVVAASHGTAKLLPAANRTRDDSDHWEMSVEGAYTDGRIPLSTGFTFDTRSGGLTCVFYNAVGADARAVIPMLVERYGRPVEESDFGTSHSANWSTPDKIEAVINEPPLAIAVSQCGPHAD